ncbi:MAG: Holliday junction branch migration protein RuvA [Immundisolibacterales bacterium]|nr:Holliday junction branch migration protein RuvA [Immundisolibacterales bacterium]
MIARLEGVLRERRPPRLLVDVGGVGYELEAPMTTFYSLPPVGEPVVLHTHQAVRDDAPCLYGFVREVERDTFRRLLRVSGVGGKVALALLSGLDADALARCVRAGDSAGLARIPGIGKKTAARLLFELKDRLPDAGGAAVDVPVEPLAEAVAALAALGFSPNEAQRRVASVDSADLDSEGIVRAALKAVVS